MLDRVAAPPDATSPPRDRNYPSGTIRNHPSGTTGVPMGPPRDQQNPPRDQPDPPRDQSGSGDILNQSDPPRDQSSRPSQNGADQPASGKGEEDDFMVFLAGFERDIVQLTKETRPRVGALPA